jgi:branched-chain amino acid aminotransferase
MSMKKEYAFVNGDIMPIKKATIGITDLGLLRGYGIFDFFRAIDGKTIYLENHLDRFERSMRFMNMESPYSRAELRENILKIAELNHAPLLGIKVIATGGYSPDGYTPTTPNIIIMGKPFTIPPFEKGLKLMLFDHVRDMSEVKTLNYSFPISQMLTLSKNGFDDVLYHKNDSVSESSRSNVFIVKNGILITPKSDILRGVTRSFLMQLAANVMTVEERDVTVSEVLNADEVFLSGSSKRVAPVLQVNDVRFASGKFSRILYDLLVKNESI